jgi:hypothetical protein
MVIPKDPRKQDLYLQHNYLLLQVKVLNKKNFHVEIMIGTHSELNIKKRLVFYSAQPYVYSRDNILR